MQSNTSLFADRFANISVTGGLVRIELAALAPVTGNEQKPELRPTQTLVMPVDGFLASFGMSEAMIKRMIEAGILKVQPKDAAAPAGAAPQTKQ